MVQKLYDINKRYVKYIFKMRE